MNVIKEATNEELFAQYKNGDDSKLAELMLKNETFLYHIARGYKNTGYELEDLVSMAKIGMIKAIKSFDLSKKIKLTSFMGACINNEILMNLRKVKKEREKETSSLQFAIAKGEHGEDRTLEDIIPAEEGMFNKDDYILLNEVMTEFYKVATEEDKVILQMRFVDNKRHKEIAEFLNISRSYVSRKITYIEHKLQDIAEHGYITNKQPGKKTDGMGKATINKEEIIYVFENYPSLTPTEISRLLHINKGSVSNCRTRFKNGKFTDVKPEITDKVKKKIELYIKSKEEVK